MAEEAEAHQPELVQEQEEEVRRPQAVSAVLFCPMCSQYVLVPLEQQRHDCVLVQGTEGTEAAGGLSKSQKKKQKKKAAAERKKVCEGTDTGPTTPPGALPAQAEPRTAHALRTQLAGSSQLRLLTRVCTQAVRARCPPLCRRATAVPMRWPQKTGTPLGSLLLFLWPRALPRRRPAKARDVV